MLVNFEEKFRKYLSEYIQENDIDEGDIDDHAEDLYFDWMDSPKDWLGGKSPNNYFNGLNSAHLIEMLGRYIFSEIPIPGSLLNSIEDKDKETYPYLISLMKNYEGKKSDRLKSVIVQLIDEMDMKHPYDYYIDSIARSTKKTDLPESCVKELKETGETFKEKIIKAYEEAENEYPSDCFLDILSDLPYDDRTYDFALEKFLYSDAKKAFYASCLGKLGNDKALPYLEEALKDEGIVYYEYAAIKNAFEELGGEVTIERDFTGDKDYEALKNMED
jgi:hypothetical protein